MRFPRSKKTLQHSQKTRQARRCITRGTETGWSSPMTRVWSCLLLGVRPECIPQGMPGCRRQIRKGLKNSWARCAVRRDPSVLHISFARLHWRNADEPWPSSRVAWTEKSWRRHVDRADLAMIRCSTSQPSRKHLRSFPPKRKINAAIGGRQSGNCSRLFPPCYSFGSYGHEVEEKTIEEEETCSAQIENREDHQISKTGACDGNGSQAGSRYPRQTG